MYFDTKSYLKTTRNHTTKLLVQSIFKTITVNNFGCEMCLTLP